MPTIDQLLADALAHERAGRLADAERLYGDALALDANHVDTRRRLASVCHRLGKLDTAATHLRHLVGLHSDDVLAHQQLAGVLGQQGKLDEATAWLEAAARLAPQAADVAGNLQTMRAAREHARGLALAKAGDLSQAEACYRLALRHKPEFIDALAALATMLCSRGRTDEAEALCRQAVERSPRQAEAHYNLAIALVKQRKIEEALACYRRAIELKPDDPDLHTIYGLTLLLAGYFEEGWTEYDWRSRRKDSEDARIAEPRWQGEPLAGRTILLRSDQGHGDALQFFRYVPLIKAQGATVVVECQQALVKLFSQCPGVDYVAARGAPVPTFDLYSSFMSLPGLFRTTADNILANVPYIASDPALTAQWKSKLGGEPGLRVGLVWQGSPTQVADKERSIPLALFSGIAAVPGVRLFSLQVGAGREQLSELAARMAIIDLGEQIADFSDTAAIVPNLDLVISCDSAPAHLSGALGVPVWVALAYAADWRWWLEREDSPWYPTMRLFRQQRPGDWPEVLERIHAALGALPTIVDRR